MANLTFNGQRILFPGGGILDFTSGPPVETYTNWYLPSQNELDAMRTNLYDESVGGFTGAGYWSSHQQNAGTGYFYIDFSTGVAQVNAGFISHRLRAARTITYVAGVYNLRDVGPGGGLIFYVDGATYYEASAADLSASEEGSSPFNIDIGTTSPNIGEGKNNTDLWVAAAFTNSAGDTCYEYSV